MGMIKRSRVLLAAFVAALGLLLTVGYLADRDTASLLATFAARDLNHRILENLQTLATQLDDAETGQRGFLITGQADYLEPYNKSVSQIHQTIQELDRLAASRPQLHQELTRLEPLVAQKLSELQETINLREQKGFQVAQAVVLTNKGKQIMDQIRVVVGQIATREQDTLVRVDLAARESSRRTQYIFWGGRAGSITLLLIVFVILIREVAVRKRTETLIKAQAASLERQASLLDIARDAIMVRDVGGLITYWNRGATKTYGWTTDQAVAKTSHSLLQTRFPHPIEQINATLLRDGLWEGELDHARSDGSRIIVLSRWVLQRDEQGRPSSVMESNNDITERKRGEESLRTLSEGLQKRTAELDRYFDLSIDMMCIAGFDGTFKRVNPAWEKVLGYSMSELLARPYLEFVHPDDRSTTNAAAASVATGQTVISFENRYKAKDGTYHWLLWNSAPSVEHGVTYAVARDITDEKRAQEAIQKLNADLQRRTSDLEAANRELEAFTYSVSHDLRAPLRHIDGFSKLLIEEHAASLTGDAQRYLTRVREGTKQMGQLVDDLLNLARVGRKELTLQVTGLDSLVEEVLAQQKADTTGRKIAWKVATLPFVECDPALMKQVFANLISNAVKYTRPRPLAVIEIGAKHDNGASIVFVRDNGVGFSMKYADKLFGVFQRLHRPEDFEGTGVGLATVQRIVHKHGGEVWAEAELDKGATFYFKLGKPI